ncbi:hypothetical protein M406DRAFT_281738, partial [Cryphonectria parasitica EP155]
MATPRAFSTTPHPAFHSSRPWADKTSNSGPSADEAKVSYPREVQAEAQEDASLSEEQDPFTAIQAESSHAAPVPLQTDLVLPPADTIVAPRPDDLDTAADQYEPASSAADLEVVGGLGDWFSEKNDNWGASKAFVGFGAAQRIDNSELLILCARRAVLEAFAIVESLKGTKKKGGLLKEAWARDGGRDGMLRVLGLTLEVDSEGQALVKGDVKGIVQALSARQATNAAPEEQMEISAEEAKEIIKSWDGSWKKISLEDVRVKFAITKRIFQLTGQTIPDAKLLYVNTVGSLLSFLVKPPPARTVMQAIEQRGELAQLPNVEVFAKRQTPVHEAQRVGRWKVIQQELEKRGLPVLGSDHVDKYREREWLRG